MRDWDFDIVGISVEFRYGLMNAIYVSDDGTYRSIYQENI